MSDHSSTKALSYFSMMQNSNLADADVSEEDKIKVMMSQSSMNLNTKLGTVLPENYTCYRCRNTGHHIRNCPLSGQDKNFQGPPRIRKSTGIPNSLLVELQSSYSPGYALATPTWKLPAPLGAPIPSLCSSTSTPSVPVLIPKEWYRYQRKQNESPLPYKANDGYSSPSASSSDGHSAPCNDRAKFSESCREKSRSVTKSSEGANLQEPKHDQNQSFNSSGTSGQPSHGKKQKKLEAGRAKDSSDLDSTCDLRQEKRRRYDDPNTHKDGSSVRHKETVGSDSKSVHPPLKKDKNDAKTQKPEEMKSRSKTQKNIWEGGIKVIPQKKISININLDVKRQEDKSGQQNSSKVDVCMQENQEQTGEEVKEPRGTEVNRKKESSPGSVTTEELTHVLEEVRDNKSAAAAEESRESKEMEDVDLWHCALSGVKDKEEDHMMGKEETLKGIPKETRGEPQSKDKRIQKP
uniref:CCHC-type domain-containing protein n=1 Tax=Iconisemion striatum TaxID=60296 RepID=A0A1A7YJ70_9TELE